MCVCCFNSTLLLLYIRGTWHFGQTNFLIKSRIPRKTDDIFMNFLSILSSGAKPSFYLLSSLSVGVFNIDRKWRGNHRLLRTLLLRLLSRREASQIHFLCPQCLRSSWCWGTHRGLSGRCETKRCRTCPQSRFHCFVTKLTQSLSDML